MIKVLHISRTMGQGGAEKVVYQLCKDASSDVKPFVASCGGAYVDELKKVNVDHLTIPDVEKKSPKVILETFTALNKYIKANNINVIHTHHRMAAFYGRMLQFVNPRLKHVYTSHNVFYGKKPLLRFALSKANIVACGMTVKKNLMKEYGIPADKVRVIYNSIEASNNQEPAVLPELPENAVKIGCIGRITKQKGFDIFVTAMKKVVQKNPNAVGILIGDGEDRDKLENMVDSLKIRNNIVFLGYQKNVLELIKKLDFVVLPSRWEGFPLTPIEVFSANKTIIVSDIENNLEIVRDDKNGLVFRTEDANDLFVKIMKMIDDPEMKAGFEAQASKDYTEKFDYSIFLKKYMNLYTEIVRKK